MIPTTLVMQTACADPRVGQAVADERLAALIDASELGGLLALFDLDAARPCSPVLDTVGQLDAAGIDLIAGTDVPNFGLPIGLALHIELSLLVAAGLSPSEALRAATRTPADRFGMTDRGRIVAGARADLVSVEGDPMRYIAATRALVGGVEGWSRDRSRRAARAGCRGASGRRGASRHRRRPAARTGWCLTSRSIWQRPSVWPGSLRPMRT